MGKLRAIFVLTSLDPRHYLSQYTFWRIPVQAHVDWTVGQFDERVGGFRERENLSTGEKAYFGVPAQYLSQYLFSCGVLNRNVPEAVVAHYAGVQA